MIGSNLEPGFLCDSDTFSLGYFLSEYMINRYLFYDFHNAGCLKNAVVIWLAALQGDMVTRKQWEAFGLCTAGFLLYTWAKSKDTSDKVSVGKRKKAT